MPPLRSGLQEPIVNQPLEVWGRCARLYACAQRKFLGGESTALHQQHKHADAAGIADGGGDTCHVGFNSHALLVTKLLELDKRPTAWDTAFHASPP